MIPNLIINSEYQDSRAWIEYINFFNNYNKIKSKTFGLLQKNPIYSQVVILDEEENFVYLQVEGIAKNYELKIERGNQSIKDFCKTFFTLYMGDMCMLHTELTENFTIPLIDYSKGQYRASINDVPSLYFKVMA